jgi:hypothetical protein
LGSVKRVYGTESDATKDAGWAWTIAAASTPAAAARVHRLGMRALLRQTV